MQLREEKYISTENYLAIERSSSIKHEYFKGEVLAMSGASFRHNKIVTNLNRAILTFLKSDECEMFGSDLRLHIPDNMLFTYPDAVIICGPPQFTDEVFDTVTNPSVIIEILSYSTRDYDRGTKFTMYRSIPSLKEYVLIDSESVFVEIFSRGEAKIWSLEEFKSLDEDFMIGAINLTVKLSEIYSGVDIIPSSNR